MTRVITFLRRGRGCLVCNGGRHPGYVRVQLAAWPRPVKTIPCPVCSGGDLEYAIQSLRGRANPAGGVA